MYSDQHKLIARLAVCFGVSVLLHGLLLLAIIATPRTGSGRYVYAGHASWNAMTVQLEPSDSHKLPSVAETKTDAKTGIPAPVPEELSVSGNSITRPERASILPGGFVSAWPNPPAPEARYQSQVIFQQAQMARARQQAFEQRQFAISRLQADIEQRLNSNGKPVDGKCVWAKNDADELRCQPKLLTRVMQADWERLIALRKTMREQGTVIDGFTVSTGDGRTMIVYQVHSANAKE